MIGPRRLAIGIVNNSKTSLWQICLSTNKQKYNINKIVNGTSEIATSHCFVHKGAICNSFLSCDILGDNFLFISPPSSWDLITEDADIISSNNPKLDLPPCQKYSLGLR